MSTVCPFCSIASGKAAASIVYQNENVLAFMDLNPAEIGHTLIVPRKHYENIYEIPEKLLAEIAAAVKQISVATKKAFDADGIKVIQLNGKAAGQVVMHIHVHVIPAFYKTGAVTGHRGRTMAKRRDLDETAQKIRENL